MGLREAVRRVGRVGRITGVALACFASLGTAPVASASIVERVVAVVGERPILLSELQHRGKPFLYRILAASPDPAQQAAHKSEMMKELLNRMVDDRLEEQSADKARITVSPDEVDNALRNVAGQGKITVAQLLAEAKKQGLSEQDYRDEIRRQVLEGKLVQLRVRGRVRVTEEDARASYGHWVNDMQQQQPVDIRILPLRIPPGASVDAAESVQKLAGEIVLRARGGEDFCALVKQYSNNGTTSQDCGSVGPQPLQNFLVPIQDAVKKMKEGQIADPIRYENQAFLVVQLAHLPQIPSYAEVKDAMAERAYGEAMERQRKLWLAELRRGVYVDLRL